MIFDLFCITVIVCFIVDISGVVDSIKGAIVRFITGSKLPFNFSIKPFDCSLCMSWWCGLIYLLAYGHFNLRSIVAVAMFAVAADTITSLILLVRDIIGSIINRIYDLLK